MVAFVPGEKVCQMAVFWLEPGELASMCKLPLPEHWTLVLIEEPSILVETTHGAKVADSKSPFTSMFGP